MKSAAPLPRFLRLIAVLLLAGTIAIWLATGAHRGWTRTSVTEMQHDAVTGIEFPVERDKFVAGVEFLAAGIGLAAALGLGSFILVRRNPAGAPQC
jgi:hypothetical protein